MYVALNYDKVNEKNGFNIGIKSIGLEKLGGRWILKLY